MTDLSGKTVLLTGGARGIGAEAARRLIACGANVALLDVRADELATVVEALGPRAAGFPADVTDIASLEGAIEAAASRFGGIDVVIANAGVAHLEPLTVADPANFDRTIAVNLAGPWHTVRLAVPHLRKSRGYVLVVASVASAVHPPLHGAYAASKAGVEALANVFRIELQSYGVGVGVAYFPYLDTPMVRDVMATTVGGELFRRLGPPLDRLVPVERAGEVIVKGVQRRARRVYAPRWVRALTILRALLPREVERQARGYHAEELIERFEAEEAAAHMEPARSVHSADTSQSLTGDGR